MSTVSALLRQVKTGQRLPNEPWLTVLPAPDAQLAAVLAFPGLAVVAADLDLGPRPAARR